MKKAQVFANPFVIVIVIFIAVFLIIFAVSSFDKLKSYKTGIELNNFVLSLNNKLAEFPARHDIGSVKEFTFSLPKEIKSLCIVDKNEKINHFINNDISPVLNNFKDENLFILPTDKFFPKKLTNFKLNSSENPSCVKTENNKVTFSFKSLGNNTLLKPSKLMEKDIDCVNIIYNGNPDEKLDIVFLANDYNDFTVFAEDVNNYINNIMLKTFPFNDSVDKFNIYRIDKSKDLGCTITSYIRCSEFKIKELASDCPNDYIFVLAERNKIRDLIRPIRSSAVSNMAKINTADKDLVLLHEFAHVFANLADEYVDENYYTGFNVKAYPNCDIEECPKWNILKLGCYQGCSLNQFYRATDNSIMRNYYKSSEFGQLNSIIINTKMEIYG